MHLMSLFYEFPHFYAGLSPFAGLPFTKGDRSSFPMAVMSLASIVSWVWVDGHGILPLFLSRSFGMAH